MTDETEIERLRAQVQSLSHQLELMTDLNAILSQKLNANVREMVKLKVGEPHGE